MVEICSVIIKGEIERTVSLSLSTISGTAKGNVLSYPPTCVIMCAMFYRSC